MVKLRDGHLPLGAGQLLSLVHHDVRERAREHVRVSAGQCGLVDQGVLEVLALQHRHQADAVLVVGCLPEFVDDPRHLLPRGGDRRPLPPLALRRGGVAEALPGSVQQRQVGDGPGLSVRPLEFPHLVGAQPGRAQPQVGGHCPEVADEIRRFEPRPGPVQGGDELAVLP
jgi:hypothetical protein